MDEDQIDYLNKALENENNTNWRNQKPRFSTRRRNRLQPNRTGAFLHLASAEPGLSTHPFV